MEKSSVHSAETDFRMLFESLPGLYLVLTPGLTIVAVSNAYLDATQKKRVEVVDKHLFDVINDSGGEAVSDGVSNLSISLSNVLRTKKADSMAVQKCVVPIAGEDTKRFEERYWKRYNSPVLDTQGRISYIIHRLEDVTEVMQARLAIEEERSKNAEIIEKKNSALAYSNAELDGFSYSVSHDLRAPLRAIYGYTKIISDNYMDRLDEEGIEMMDNVMKNVKKMGQLIDDLLAFARISKKELLKTTINMTDVARKTLLELKQTDTVQNAIINILPLPAAKGDYTLINQVFTNLISNAVKYSHRKEYPTVEVGSFEKDGDDVYYVKDNGVGFEMKYYNKLFGVFQRLHSANDFEGNGVGLAMVKRIIAKHGGNVWAEAEPGQGATFYFSLPR